MLQRHNNEFKLTQTTVMVKNSTNINNMNMASNSVAQTLLPQ